MRSYKEKTAILILLTVMICGGIAVADLEAGNDSTITNKKLPGSDDSNYQMLINTLKAILFVGIFGAAAFYITTKLVPKIANSSDKNIRIIEHVSLGTRKSLHLIEIADRRILLGSGVDKIVKICEFKSEAHPVNEQDEKHNG